MLRKRKCDRHRKKGERCVRDGMDEEGRAKRQTDKRVDADRMRHREVGERCGRRGERQTDKRVDADRMRHRETWE